MTNDLNNELIRELINNTIILKNEIKKLNNRLNTKVVRNMIENDIIDNSLLFNTNSYNNPKKRYREPLKIENNKIVVNFD